MKKAQGPVKYSDSAFKPKLAENHKSLLNCLELRMKQGPLKDGPLQLVVTIRPNGSVFKAKVDKTFDKAFEDCILSQIRLMTFPPPPNGKAIKVIYGMNVDATAGELFY